MKKIGSILLSSLFLVSVIMFFNLSPAYSASEAAMMKNANRYMLQRGNIRSAKKGVKVLQEILKKNPKNIQAYEMLSRLTVFLAMDLATNKKTAMDAYEYMGIAGEVTDAWLKLEPESVGANFWKGYAAAASKDVKTALKYCQKAVDIDPKYMDGLPNILMGYLKGVLPPFLGGDLKAAYKYLEKAMEAAPDNIMIHRIKAMLLVNEAKTASKKALVHLQFVIESEPTKGWEPEGRRDKAVANKLMKAYGDALKIVSK
ncbi:MAG: TRAP transporter TatT component family protein [Spirochaetota bacterium]|nr:TRAP transporter TatT component family protein [Spirochaetota bacterium]